MPATVTIYNKTDFRIKVGLFIGDDRRCLILLWHEGDSPNSNVDPNGVFTISPEETVRHEIELGRPVWTVRYPNLKRLTFLTISEHKVTDLTLATDILIEPTDQN